METDKKIRVMLVDDHDMVRMGLAAMVDSFDDLALVGEAPNGEEAIRLCADWKPDVILMDMKMPGIDGTETTRAIRSQHPQIQVIALTSFKEESLVKAALEAGAIGYLLKNTSIDDLAQAIRKAHIGEPSLATEATQALIQATVRPAAPSYRLTAREIEVLALMTEGLTNRQISLRLEVSISTVKFHVSSVLSKLGAASRTEAVALAVENNLIS